MKIPTSLTMKLYLTPDGDEYLKLCEIYKANGKRELTEKLEGALNNWILEMLLDQESED